ncbi:MAG: c-type cytochrome biogenesis protein CcsB [Deltaproteobacteria bacterium]|nr:c-type cytochrome biogenesis protein CcsB [Deltaproteobacteria bacterium]
MTALVFGKLALVFIFLATAGLIIYIINQKKTVYLWSYRLLVAGFSCLSLQIGCNYYELGVAPVLTFKSSLSFFAWTILGAYLVFQLKFRLMVLGSFIAPLVACLLIMSTAISGAEVTVKPMLRSFWLTVHVVASFVGNGIFALTFMAGIMYLSQERQIKKKTFGSLYARLPSLATLDSINHYSLIWGFSFLTIGIITGVIYAQYALGSYWQWDPKEVWSLITWLFYAALLHERLAVGWRGRRAALMAIIGFAVLSFTFVGASLWLSDYHSFRNLGGFAYQ